jgi:Meckel syndrome type 1 protein
MLAQLDVNKTPQLEAVAEKYRSPVEPAAPVAVRQQKVAQTLHKSGGVASAPRQSNPSKQPKSAPTVEATLPAAEPAISLERRLALFLSAMKANELDAAKVQLTVVQELLVPGALSRLRAEAWFALRTGDRDLARQTYHHILERAPGDEEASLNLASLEAQANRSDVVGQILADGLRGNPDSTALRDALVRFNAVGRN